MTEPESEPPPDAAPPPDPETADPKPESNPEAEENPQEEHDLIAANPFYRGARFSEVVRILLSPLDPEVREEIRRTARRGSGPPPGREPDPGT